MKPEYLNQKSYTVNDELLYSCVYESLLQACRMIAPTSKSEHVRIIFDSVLPAIRKFYNDFTMNNLASCFEAGSYGLYGSYTKINGAVVINWLMKKREELFREEEENERKQVNKIRNEKHLLTGNNGGYAVLLGLFYHENRLKPIPFDSRLKLVEEKGVCPHTQIPVMDVINKYVSR